VNFPKYTARLSVIVASLVFICSIAYQNLSGFLEAKKNIQARETSSSQESMGEASLRVPNFVEQLCSNFYQVVCKKTEVLSDPTGTVQSDIKGEVEALRLYEMILHEHPSWSNEQVDEELVNRIYTPRRKKMLLESYEWVRKRIIRFIEKQPERAISPQVKKEISRRLSAIVLELPPPVGIYSNEPDLFTKNDVYYESLPGHKTVIRVGGAYLLSAKSWFNRVFTLAHEMSHSIDPCELEAANIKVPGYEKLLSCFQEQNPVTHEQLKNGCNKSNFTGEIFSDWIATHIAVQAIELYTSKFKNHEELVNSVINSVKDLCSQESWIETRSESHPDARIRIENIFGTNPRIQELLSCPTAKKKNDYCTFEGKR